MKRTIFDGYPRKVRFMQFGYWVSIALLVLLGLVLLAYSQLSWGLGILGFALVRCLLLVPMSKLKSPPFVPSGSHTWRSYGMIFFLQGVFLMSTLVIAALIALVPGLFTKRS